MSSPHVPSAHVQTIQNDFLVLQVLPELGGSLLGLSTRGGQPILRPVAQIPSNVSHAACFPLVPFSNRVEGGSFVFEGRHIQLAPPARHGVARNHPWTAEQLSEQHLRLHYTHHANAEWPYDFGARLEYILHGPHCDISLSLTNHDAQLMPAGIGLHPYFATTDQAGTPPLLQFGAELYYPTGDDLLPTTEAIAVSQEEDYRTPRPLAPHTDRVYSAWDGIAQLIWPERRLILTADNTYSHLVLFAAPDGSVALEPVSHATNAFHLAARGIAGNDLRVLQQGQAIAGTLRLSLEGQWA